MRPITKALTFHDVLLVPAHSKILPRDVALRTRITRNITISIPIVSAAMDTVTEARLAIALAQEGGIGRAQEPAGTCPGSRGGQGQALRIGGAEREIAGTVLLVHVANMPSFLGRTIYYGPEDQKNLNRVFPGKPDGTQSERIAFGLTREIIDRATHVIDIHCGDGNEWLRPYSYWVVTSAPAVVAANKDLALAFGLDHIVIDTERPNDPAASVYLANTAMTRGKPALTAESGGWSRTDEESIARVERGVAGVLKHLGMRAEGPAPVAHPVWLGRNEVLRAGFTGLLYPMVEPGQTVAQGTLVARITDFHGAVLEEVRAPFAGEILYVDATPPITKGEPVGFVAERATELPRIPAAGAIK